jgi:elongation factor Ts
MSAITASAVKELREKTGVSMMACKKVLEETAGDMTTAIELLRKRGEAVAQKRSSYAAKEGKIVAGREGNAVALVEVGCETDFTARNDDFLGFTNSVLATALASKPADMDGLLAASMGAVTVAQATADIVGKIGENISAKRFKLVEVASEQTAEAYIHGPGKIGVVVLLSHAGSASNEAASTLAKDICLQIAAAAPVALNSSDISDDVLAKEREIYADQAKAEGIKEDKLPMVVEGRVKKFLKEAALVEQVYVKGDGKSLVSKHVEQVAKEANLPGLKIESFVRFQLGEG